MTKDLETIAGSVELTARGLSPLEQAAVAIAAGMQPLMVPRGQDADRTDEQHAEILRWLAVECVDFAEAVLVECARRSPPAIIIDPTNGRAWQAFSELYEKARTATQAKVAYDETMDRLKAAGHIINFAAAKAAQEAHASAGVALQRARGDLYLEFTSFLRTLNLDENQGGRLSV